MCNGSTTPGNRGVPSGKSGISSPIPSAYEPASRSGWLPWESSPRVPEATVLARIDLRGSALPPTRELAGLLPRAATDIDSVMATVRPLCQDVRVRGAQAVREITARLDGVDSEDFAVPAAALDRALAGCDPTLRAALEEAIDRVRRGTATRGAPTAARRAPRAAGGPGRGLPSGAAGSTCRAGWGRRPPAW